MRRSPIPLAALLAALSVIVVGVGALPVPTNEEDASGSAIEEPPTVEPFTPFEPLDPASFRPEFSAADLAFHGQLASEAGVDTEAVTSEQENAYRLGALVAQVELQVPGTLLAARWVAPWESDEAPGGVLTFAGVVPTTAAELSARSGLPVRLVAVDAPDQDRAIVIAESLIELLEAEGLDDGMWGEFDLSRSAFVIYSPGAIPTAAELERVAHVADGYPVIALQASDAEAEYQGGNPISSEDPDCTSGFVVRNGSTFGITTAAHCLHLTGNYPYGDGYFTNAGVLSRFRGDVRWGWAVSGAPTRLFRATTTSSATVTNVVSPVVGMGYCQYGKTTFTTCSTVASTNQSGDYPNDAQGTIYRLACSHYYYTAGGDSGGPVFGGGTAVGIDSGRVDGRSCFSTVVELYLGAYVDVYR